MIIEIEGIDGTGKTTQCHLLKCAIEERGKQAIIVKDLESTELGKQIRTILVTDAPRSSGMELFSFLCCKAHLLEQVVLPELEKGTYIICDRGRGSLLSYFEALGFSRTFLLEALSFVLPPQYASRTFYIDLEVKEALRRNTTKPVASKFDKMGADFFERQRHIYHELAQKEAWVVIDGTHPIDTIHRMILTALDGC